MAARVARDSIQKVMENDKKYTREKSELLRSIMGQCTHAMRGKLEGQDCWK
jgi:hypothetical protein